MTHFQYSVMGHGILLRSLGWATKIFGANIISSSGPPLSMQLLHDRSLTTARATYRATHIHVAICRKTLQDINTSL